jgi:hypothetical protein
MSAVSYDQPGELHGRDAPDPCQLPKQQPRLDGGCPATTGSPTDNTLVREP